MSLADVTKSTLEKIKIAEKEKDYHRHLDSSPMEDYYPVDEDFSYEKVWYVKLAYALIRYFLIVPYSWIANLFWFRTKVIGKEKLNQIHGGAIITCNHINKLDSLCIGYALNSAERIIHYTTAEFNNLKGRLGVYMRAYGAMPIPNQTSSLKKFQKQLEQYLNKKQWINFFPEGAEWWCYEKPRPYQAGAFHYASKFQVPIVPLFITFTKTNRFDKIGIEKRRCVVHILDPIYPKKDLSIKENKEELRKKNEQMIWECYHKFYKI